MSVAIAVLSLTSCNDYDSAAIGYEEVDVQPSKTTASAPELKSEWKLKEVINVGQHDDNVFVYQDNLYRSLFTRSLGWNGGDIQASFKVNDGTVAFLYRDGYYGKVDDATRARVNSNLVRNGILMLTSDNGTLSEPSPKDLYSLNDYVQTVDANAADYYNGVPLAASSKSAYHVWPGVACLYNGQIQVQWVSYRTSLGRRDESSIYTYSLNGKPSDSGFLKLKSTLQPLFSNLIGYDDYLWQDDDGHNYIYCTYILSGISGVLVARTATHDLSSEWEYCVRNTDGQIVWTKTIPTATITAAGEVALRSNMLENNGACQHPQVIKKGSFYYLIGQSYPNLADVRIWRSATPYGPFEDAKSLFVVPESVTKKGNVYYNELSRVVLHPALSRSGELVFSTVQTAPTDKENFDYPGSADYVTPMFYRVYNWESLFE